MPHAACCMPHGLLLSVAALMREQLHRDAERWGVQNYCDTQFYACCMRLPDPAPAAAARGICVYWQVMPHTTSQDRQPLPPPAASYACVQQHSNAFNAAAAACHFQSHLTPPCAGALPLGAFPPVYTCVCVYLSLPLYLSTLLYLALSLSLSLCVSAFKCYSKLPF